MKRLLFIIAIFLIFNIGIIALGRDQIPYGISIDQNSLDILTLAIKSFNEQRSSNDYDQTISIKAKIIIADIIQPDLIPIDIPDMILNAHIDTIKTQPDIIRVNLSSNLGEIQFIASGTDSLAVLPQERLFAKTYFPEMLPAKLLFPYDNAGLFTMLNILGGIPFGSLLTGSSIGNGGKDIQFVEEIAPEDLKAVIRYLGMDKIEGGMAYVISIGSRLYRQYMKIWILRDNLQIYQVSIEDERGTEIFVILTELDTTKMSSHEIASIDTKGMSEISQEELYGIFLQKVIFAPPINYPIVADLYLSHDPVARTGTVLVSSDGFDMQDKENQLSCEISYKSPSGIWTPLKTEYAGLTPIGHWNAEFAIPANAELGKYSFRARYTDTSGYTSNWAEYFDLLTVTPEPPRITNVTPRGGDINVPVSTKISITFSKPMNKESVEKAFSMVSSKDVISKGLYTWEGNTMIFTPNVNLDYNTRYLAVISGTAKDENNIGLDGNFDARSDGIFYDDYIWEFMTGKVSPTIAFAPINKSVYVGDIFDVRISAKNVVSLQKFAFKVKFDPMFFEIVGFKKESFLSWKPVSSSAKEADLWKNVVVDNSNGIATFACDGTRNKGVSGSGYLAIITLKCKSSEKSTLRFSDVFAYNSDGAIINMASHSIDIYALQYHPNDKNQDGVVDIRDNIEDSKGAPISVKFSLDQNYPNPFNPETWIPFQLATPADVNIRIYKINGELVRTLDLGYRPAGFYKDIEKSAYWDGMDDNGQRVSSGIYFYTIKAGNWTATKKMIIQQ